MLTEKANFWKNNVDKCVFSIDGVRNYILAGNVLRKLYNLLRFCVQFFKILQFMDFLKIKLLR